MLVAILMVLGIASGLLLVVSNLWFFFRVLRPLKRLSLSAEQISQGNINSLEYPGGGIAEIRALRRAMAAMAGHVRRSQEQSRAYADQLADGQEVERKRLAHELHDDTLQALIVINQSIDLATTWMQRDPERARQMLQSAREQVVRTATSLRNLIGDLRPPALEELGLVAALEMEAEKMPELPVSIGVTGVQRRLSEVQELALFRAAQEVLHNAQRHSQAAKVELTVGYQPEGVSLSVADDGCGFALPAHLSDLVQQRHYGLIGLEERIHTLGGKVTINSAVGMGTTVEVFLPSSEVSQPDQRVRDPVCSALLEPQQAYGSATYGGETYYFCCPVCQGAFQKDPLLYLAADTLAHKKP